MRKEYAVKAANEVAFEAVQELLEKSDKKQNLVIVGMPESRDTETEQHSADVDKVHEYCDKIGIPRQAVRSVFRDGRKFPQKARIVKVCFEDRMVFERRQFLMRATHMLREDPQFSSASFRPFVRPDRTKKERDQDFALREQLRARKAAEPHLIFRNGHIIRDPSKPPVSPEDLNDK